MNQLFGLAVIFAIGFAIAIFVINMSDSNTEVDRGVTFAGNEISK